MNTVFIFDMDGVLIDSVQLLYDVYREFVKGFGVRGNQEEFSVLNGKKLTEILSYLKTTHQLPLAVEELVARYDHAMKAAYSKAPLMPGVTESLRLLRRHKFHVALASSSTRENIEYIVRKFKLAKYVDVIVSGDDVTNAKPSPEIYQRVRASFKHHAYYVIEDSQHGIESASAAGMHVIAFDPGRRRMNHEAAETISDLKDLGRIIEEIQTPCRAIDARKIEVRITNHRLALTPQQGRAIKTLWKQATRSNPSLFDGQMMSYRSHRWDKGTLLIECLMTNYRYFLSQLKHPALQLPVFPLTVAGVILDECDNTLLGRRTAGVTEYQGCYEFVPSGGIGAETVKERHVLFTQQLEDEFKEEIGLPLMSISRIEPFSLAFDARHQLYVICCTIKIAGDLHAMKPRLNPKEHDVLKVMKRTKLKQFIGEHHVVPTCRLIVERINGACAEC